MTSRCRFYTHSVDRGSCDRGRGKSCFWVAGVERYRRSARARKRLMDVCKTTSDGSWLLSCGAKECVAWGKSRVPMLAC